MPRIRSMKPEHRQHRKVGPLTDREYRLWASMILEADDQGRFVCDAAQLRVVTWSYHPRVTHEHVEAAIQAIAATGLVRLYEVGGVRYGWFPSWHDHQRPKYPTPSKLPQFSLSPRAPEEEGEDSPRTSPGLPQDSGSVPPGVGLRGVGLREVGLSREGRRGSGRGNQGDFERVLESIRKKHPELAQHEAEQHALGEIQAGAQERRV